ncbi:MAG: hypothetical protein ACT443_13510 [Gemmatimonadota bacterium]
MRRSFLMLALLVALPMAAPAQSLFGTKGLGVPLPGIDARARALGVNGVGLMGLSTSLTNPAQPAGIFRRGVSAAFQPWGGSVELNGEEDDISGTRFPMIAAFYPMGRFTFTLGYAGMLDQSWAIVAEGDNVFGGDTVGVSDVVRSSGGIGEVKLGAAHYMNDRLSFGASIGLHTGNLQREIRREFEDSVFVPFRTSQNWQYSGPTASLGVRWDPITQLRIAASVAWSGDLEADPDTGTTSSHEYDMPLRFSAGASGQILPRLLLAVSATIADYGSGSYSAPGTSAQTVAQRTVEMGVGLEWSELRAGNRIFQIRLGARRADLPFHNVAEDPASEWSLSGGLGLRLVEDDFGPLAVADIGFERGKRAGWEGPASPDGLSESFWRLTVSVSLFGR